MKYPFFVLYRELPMGPWEVVGEFVGFSEAVRYTRRMRATESDGGKNEYRVVQAVPEWVEEWVEEQITTVEP